MLRATQSSEIPDGDLARIKADDSDRTKMLKEVMKSTAKYASGGLGKGHNESAQAAGQLIMKSMDDDAEKIVVQKEWDPVKIGWLSAEEERMIRSTVDIDEEVLNQAANREFAELLKHNGRRILKDCDNLSISGPLPDKPPYIESGPTDIQLVYQFEAQDIMAGGATDAQRQEQAAGAWVQDNAKFEELDALTSRIDKTEKYEDLRANFDSHHKYHQVLVHLTDHSLIYEGLWQTAIQEAMFPPAVETKIQRSRSKGAKPDLFAPKGLSRSSKSTSNLQVPGGKVSPASPKGAKSIRISFASPGAGPGSGSGNRKLQRGQSVPSLR
jgi:hypothetical protein